MENATTITVAIISARFLALSMKLLRLFSFATTAALLISPPPNLLAADSWFDLCDDPKWWVYSQKRFIQDEENKKIVSKRFDFEVTN